MSKHIHINTILALLPIPFGVAALFLLQYGYSVCATLSGLAFLAWLAVAGRTLTVVWR